MMGDAGDRRAEFVSVVALMDEDLRIRTFRGTLKGEIAEEASIK